MRRGTHRALLYKRPAAVVASGPVWHTTPEFGTATFTNSNRTVEYGGAESIIRLANPVVGKKLFAVQIDVQVNYNTFGCFAPRNTPTSGLGADGTNSLAIYDNASNSYGGDNPPAGSYDAADQIGVVLDETAGLMWFTPNGTDFYGSSNGGTPRTKANVEAGVGGVNVSTLSSDVVDFYGGVGNGFGAAGGGKVTLLTSWPWASVSGFSYVS